MLDRIFEEALKYATEKHRGMLRKAEDIPFIIHPMEVATIAASMTTDRAVLAACLLHDTVEDTDATIEDITEKFGERIARLVSCETEDKHADRPANETWEQRKAESLAKLAKADDINVKIMWLSDKLANLRAFYRNYLEYGDDMWNLFNQKDPAKHEWYYRQIGELTSELSNFVAWREYNNYLDMLFGGNDNESD